MGSNRRDFIKGAPDPVAVASWQTVFPGHTACARLARLAEDFSQGRCSNEVFLLDYEALFRVPGQAYTHPYQSAYVVSSDRDQGQGKPFLDAGRTRQVAAAYQRQGLAPTEGFDEPPDHIAVQFDFMSCLCQMAAEALDQGDSGEALRLSSEQEAFLREHPLAWGSDCLDRVAGKAATELYESLAEPAKSFLAQEGEEFHLSRDGGAVK